MINGYSFDPEDEYEELRRQDLKHRRQEREESRRAWDHESTEPEYDEDEEHAED